MQVVLKSLSLSKPPLRTFLNKCVETLWYMQIQEPPVYLEFSPTDDPMMYQPITEPKSQLREVIWPAVKLHKNGLGLRKGVGMFAEIDKSVEPYKEFEEKEEVSKIEDDPTQYYLYTDATKNYYYFDQK